MSGGKIMKRIFIVAVSISGLMLLSCSPSSEKLMPKPKHKSNKSTHDTFDPIVDILFVIDNSGSMQSHQTNLANNVRLFVDKIKQFQILDYHIGVTTTSVYESYSKSEDGQLVGKPLVVDKNTPNLDAALYNNMLVGTDGSAEEMPFAATYLALTEPNLSGANAGFYRPRADLAIIYLTDTEDQSEDVVKDASFLQQFLFSLKGGDSSKIHTYGAIVPSNVYDCQRESYSLPVRIENFFSLTGGISFSLCDPNFGAKLALIGDNLVGKIAQTIRLSQIPIPSTIRVTYGTQIVPNDRRYGWVYNPAENSLLLGPDFELSDQQPQGTKLEIYFTVADSFP